VRYTCARENITALMLIGRDDVVEKIILAISVVIVQKELERVLNANLDFLLACLFYILAPLHFS
jgi:hypothetical protein